MSYHLIGHSQRHDTILHRFFVNAVLNQGGPTATPTYPVKLLDIGRKWRWRGQKWRFWAGVVTCGLQFRQVGRSAKWAKLTLEAAYGRGINAPSKLETFVALCCVTKPHILEWPFIVPSRRCTCVIIMLLNQLRDLPHLARVKYLLYLFHHHGLFLPSPPLSHLICSHLI